MPFLFFLKETLYLGLDQPRYSYQYTRVLSKNQAPIANIAIWHFCTYFCYKIINLEARIKEDFNNLNFNKNAKTATNNIQIIQYKFYFCPKVCHCHKTLIIFSFRNLNLHRWFYFISYKEKHNLESYSHQRFLRLKNHPPSNASWGPWKVIFDEICGLEGDFSYLSRSTLQYELKKLKINYSPFIERKQILETLLHLCHVEVLQNQIQFIVID